VEQETMRIGQVASAAGVNIQTLRYYERRGLLEQPGRTSAGHREYLEDAVRRVGFIKGAQELGFALVEIQQILRLREDRSSSCGTMRAAARAKIEDIDRKIRSLRAMKRSLVILERSCSTDRSTRACPILAALDDSATRRRRR